MSSDWGGGRFYLISTGAGKWKEGFWGSYVPVRMRGGPKGKTACLFPWSGWPQDRFRASVELKHRTIKPSPFLLARWYLRSLAPEAVLALLLYCRGSKGRRHEPSICNYSGVFKEFPALLPPIHSKPSRVSPILYSWGRG